MTFTVKNLAPRKKNYVVAIVVVLFLLAFVPFLVRQVKLWILAGQIRQTSKEMELLSGGMQKLKEQRQDTATSCQSTLSGLHRDAEWLRGQYDGLLKTRAELWEKMEGIMWYSIFSTNVAVASEPSDYRPSNAKDGYRKNSNGYAKPQPFIDWITVAERTNNYLAYYGQIYSIWDKIMREEGIKTEVAVCIAWADSHLWYAMTTDNNIGNVGNTDSGERRSFDTEESGIRAIASLALNGKYLSDATMVWELSNGWLEVLWLSRRAVYATSKSSWNANVLNCLTNIHNEKIDEKFEFRLQ